MALPFTVNGINNAFEFGDDVGLSILMDKVETPTLQLDDIQANNKGNKGNNKSNSKKQKKVVNALDMSLGMCV